MALIPFTSFMFRRKQKAAVTIDITYQEPISRLFVFRFLWIVPLVVPLLLYTIWFRILTIVHIVYMLILGKRNREFFTQQMYYVRYWGTWVAYLGCFTNARPAILPWKL